MQALIPQLFSNGLRLVPLWPRSKRPYAAEQPDLHTHWRVVFIDDAGKWESFASAHPGCNLAIYWLGTQVDADSDPALTWAFAHGLHWDLRCWTIRTARGWRFLFRSSGPNLATHIDSTHQTPDLLAPGRLATVPPSVHPAGTPYRWVEGHSPSDIPFHDLTPLPDELRAAWASLAPLPAPRRANLVGPSWLALVFEAICIHLEGTGHRLRNQHNGGFTTTCPFHDDRNPSFSVHPERGWKCFAGCGEGRLTLLAARLGVRVPGASA